MQKKIKQIFIAAIIFTVLAQVIHSVGASIGMAYYFEPAYQNVWSKLMMPNVGPPPASFMVYSLIFGFIASLIYSWFFVLIKKAIPEKDVMSKGIWYGGILYLVGSFPGLLSMYLLINLPVGLLTLWSFESLIIDLLGGVVIAYIIR